MLLCLEGTNSEIREIISRKTTVAENMIRDKVVIPYCKKHGYSFSAGMGSWNFSDRDGEIFEPGVTYHKRRDRPSRSCDPKYDEDEWFIEPTDEDREVREILSWFFDCMNQSIGSFIKDYRP